MRPPIYIYPVAGIVVFAIASGVMWWHTDVSDEARVTLPPVASEAAVEQARIRVEKVSVEVGKMAQAQQEMESALANLKQSEALMDDMKKLSQRSSELAHPKLLRDPGPQPPSGARAGDVPTQVLEAYHSETGISPERIDEMMKGTQ